MLPGREFVSLTSVVPAHPGAAVDTVNVVVCLDADEQCKAIVPASWSRQTWGSVTVATRN
jgi:hypothetical protein